MIKTSLWPLYIAGLSCNKARKTERGLFGKAQKPSAMTEPVTAQGHLNKIEGVQK